MPTFPTTPCIYTHAKCTLKWHTRVKQLTASSSRNAKYPSSARDPVMKSQKTQRMALLNRALGGVGALPLSVYCEDITDTMDPTDEGSRLDNLSNTSQVQIFEK